MIKKSALPTTKQGMRYLKKSIIIVWHRVSDLRNQLHGML